jgi:parallel beta-helix repeat protein
MGIIGGTTTQNITITHNVSEGTTLAENLAIVDACYCEVSFNHIKQPTTSNIFNGVEFFLVTPGAMVGNKIIGNTFENSGTAGVAAGGDVQTTVAGNTFVSCNYALLGDENAGTPSVGGTFSGNVIISPVSAAVLFQSAHDWTVSANTVRGSAGAGMIIGGTGHVIEGNSVVGSASVGFSILGSYNTVTGNSAVDNSRGFGVSGDSNAIHDNVATDTRTPKVQDFGLVFTSGADNNIYGGNMLTGNLNGTISDAGSGNLSAVKTGDSPRFATVTVTANLTKDATKLYLDLDTSGVTGFPSADFVFGGGGIFRVAKVSVVGTNDIFFQALPPSSAGFGIIETYGGAGTGLSTGGPGQPILMLPNRTERGRFDDNGLSVTGILSVSPNYPNGLKFDSSTLMYGGSSNFTFYDFSQNNARIGNVGVRLASNRQLAWANTNDATQAADTGLDRNAAGVVEVNNGTPGTLRDFKARAINLSSLTPSGSADSTGNQGDFRWDDSFVYVKTSGGWKRSALSTF